MQQELAKELPSFKYIFIYQTIFSLVYFVHPFISLNKNNMKNNDEDCVWTHDRTD